MVTLAENRFLCTGWKRCKKCGFAPPLPDGRPVLQCHTGCEGCAQCHGRRVPVTDGPRSVTAKASMNSGGTHAPKPPGRDRLPTAYPYYYG
jgi:hypothetical protein